MLQIKMALYQATCLVKNYCTSYDTPQVGEKRKLFEERTTSEIQSLKSTHMEGMNLAKAEKEEEIRKLSEAHERLLNAEVSRTRSAEADLEEERLKRRRADRESKVHREEAQRYKTQLTCSSGTGTGSSGDVDAALKELKAMAAQVYSCVSRLFDFNIM